MSSFELPDELLDKHFADTSDDEAVDETPEPDAEDESPELDEEETSDEEPSDDDADTDEDEAGDEDPVDEDEQDEDKEETSEDEPSDEESFLPKFDRKKIEADPELNKAYKHMQAAFTKRMQDFSKAEQEANAARAEVEAFVEELSSDEGAENLLIKVALNRPEVFRRAMERAEELTDDPDEKRRFDREQELLKREAELKRLERERAAEEQRARVRQIDAVTKKAASRYDMDETEFKIAKQYVANAIYRVRSEGGQNITEEDIVRAVKRAASDLALKKARVKEDLTREVRAEERKRLKDKAKNAKRPAAPRSSAAPAKRRGKIEVPKGEDPLMYMISQRLLD